jgi:hypothetical protein
MAGAGRLPGAALDVVVAGGGFQASSVFSLGRTCAIEQFLHTAERLIDGRVGIGRGAGVRVGDRDASRGTASDFVRRLACRPLRIVERVVFVAVSVRPAVHRDGFDVARRIEAAVAEDACELPQEWVSEGGRIASRRARACNAPREWRYCWHPWQRRIRKLLILKEPRGFESHPLRHPSRPRS